MQRLIENGIICGDKQWPLANRKTVSLLYLNFGAEGRRILNGKNPLITIDCRVLENSRRCVQLTKNVVLDRYFFIIAKQIVEEHLNTSKGNAKIQPKVVTMRTRKKP